MFCKDKKLKRKKLIDGADKTKKRSMKYIDHVKSIYLSLFNSTIDSDERDSEISIYFYISL